MADPDMIATLNNLTVPELQQELKKRGLKRSGLKPKLVARLAEHIQTFEDEAQHESTPAETPEEKVEEKKVLDIKDPHPYNEEYEQQLTNDANDETMRELHQKENGDRRVLDIEEDKTHDDDQEAEKEDEFIPAIAREDSLEEDIGENKEDNTEENTAAFYENSNDDARNMAEQLTEPIHVSKDHQRTVEVENEEEEEEKDLQEEDSAPQVDQEEDSAPQVDQDDVLEEATEQNDVVEEEEAELHNDEEERDEEEDDHENIGDGDDKEQEENEEHDALRDEDDDEMEEEHKEDEDGKEEEKEGEKEEVDIEGDIDIQPTKEDKSFLEEDAEEDEEKKTAPFGVLVGGSSPVSYSSEILVNSIMSEVVDSLISEREGTNSPMEEGEVIEGVMQKPVTPVLLKKRLSTATDETDAEKKAKRKRRWGNTTETSLTISSDSIKKLIPDVKLDSVDSAAVENLPELDYQEDENEFAEEAEQENKEEEEVSQEEEGDGERKRKGRRVKVDSAKKIKMDQPEDKGGVVVVESDTEARKKSSQEVVDLEGEKPSETSRGDSPSRGEFSQWLFISGLVRPYTINQLKNLLSKTGTIAENGFWINNIKSFCYVKMSTEDEIKSTMESLHGKTWPSGSPKTLHVEYALNEVVWASTEGAIGEKPKIVIEIDDKENENRLANEKSSSSSLEKRKAREEHQERKKQRETERQEKAERQERRKERKSLDAKTPEKAQQKEAKRKEEESPAKLLDDLFRKTKATPCIYWLPLTEDQILEREKEEQELEKQRVRRERERTERTERENSNRGRRGNSPRRNNHSSSRRRSRSRDRGWR